VAKCDQVDCLEGVSADGNIVLAHTFFEEGAPVFLAREDGALCDGAFTLLSAHHNHVELVTREEASNSLSNAGRFLCF
jgi:hypothetical protein